MVERIIHDISEQEVELAEMCNRMQNIIASNGPLQLKTNPHAFHALCDSIVSQQLSVKAASTIFSRFVELLEGEVHPQKVLKLHNDRMRSCGLSDSKTKYIKDLAEHFAHRKAEFNRLDQMSNQEVVQRLTEIKGIGVWTAQMFLMFSLGRPDVFAPDDLGIRKAVALHYPETAEISRQELGMFSKRWSPHRTVACLHLWKSLETKKAT